MDGHREAERRRGEPIPRQQTPDGAHVAAEQAAPTDEQRPVPTRLADAGRDGDGAGPMERRSLGGEPGDDGHRRPSRARRTLATVASSPTLR